MTNELVVVDKVFESPEQNYILGYCLDANYHYGEQDNNDTPPTGMVHNIEKNQKIYQLFSNRINEIYSKYVNGLSLYRMYVNSFSPNEQPYFHTDGEDGFTVLYYPIGYEWNVNDGGETQFYIDGDLYGVTPEPNRMVLFDASMLHCAKTFRNRYRFSIAIKYE